MQIHIARDGQRFGPYSLEQLAAMLQQGQLAPTDSYWTEGMADWLPVAQFVATHRELTANFPLPRTTEYAGFWLRFLAYFIDSLLLGMPLQFINGLLFGEQMTQFNSVLKANPNNDAVIMAAFSEFLPAMSAMMAIGTFAGLIYNVALTTSSLQATVGKKLLGIKVTNEHGGRISVGQAIGRELGKFLSGFIFMIGYIMAGVDARKQALHDKLAKTFCIVAK